MPVTGDNPPIGLTRCSSRRAGLGRHAPQVLTDINTDQAASPPSSLHQSPALPAVQPAPEAPAEVGAREALLDRVMGPARFFKPSERLRRGRKPADRLALVARDGGRLVGTVRLWHVRAGAVPALLLGPLAVDHTAQGDGIGAALMRLAIARASMIGHASIILVGDPEYYERFGFSAGLTTGLVMPAPVERRRFLGLELIPDGLAATSGLVSTSGEAAQEPALLAA